MILEPKTIDDIAANREVLCTALESGRFKQTAGCLRSYDRARHCCLGVACEVSESGGWVSRQTYQVGESSSFKTLPRPLMNALGFSPRDADELIRLNDTVRAPFRLIARHIRELPLPTEVPS